MRRFGLFKLSITHQKLSSALFLSTCFWNPINESQSFPLTPSYIEKSCYSYTISTRLSSETQYNFSSRTNEKDHNKMLPTMIVFDLDDCLWSPEMYTLRDVPSIPEIGDLTPQGLPDLNARGCVGMKVPHGPTVKLFSGARRALYELATNPEYKGIIIASASSSEEPTFSYSCLNGIEILPGLTMDKMFKYNQIGRAGQLTSDKRTHFRLLHKESKVKYEEMLFFDDCNWGDHCSTVTREFGVVSMRTPRGMEYSEFLEALEKYRMQAEKRAAGY